MAICRHCGTDLQALPEPLGICDACPNSPFCDRCGHPRDAHRQVVAPGDTPSCEWEVTDFQSLSSGTCACAGFRPGRGTDVAERLVLRLA